jgi:hypothetical protein
VPDSQARSALVLVTIQAARSATNCLTTPAARSAIDCLTIQAARSAQRGARARAADCDGGSLRGAPDDAGWSERQARGSDAPPALLCALTFELRRPRRRSRLALEGTMYQLALEGPSGSAGGGRLERRVRAHLGTRANLCAAAFQQALGRQSDRGVGGERAAVERTANGVARHGNRRGSLGGDGRGHRRDRAMSEPWRGLTRERMRKNQGDGQGALGCD